MHRLALFALLLSLPCGLVGGNCREHQNNQRKPADVGVAVLQLGHDVEDVELSDPTERINLRYYEELDYIYQGRTCSVSGTFSYDPIAFELVDCRNTTNAGYEPNVDFACTVLEPGLLQIDVWKTDGGAFASDDHELMKTEFAILTETPGDYLAVGVSGNGRFINSQGGCGNLTNRLGFETSIWRAQ
jgi:hypothetical protein